MAKWFPEDWTGMGDYCSSWNKAHSSSFWIVSMPTFQGLETRTVFTVTAVLRELLEVLHLPWMEGTAQPLQQQSQISGTAACQAHTDVLYNSQFRHYHLSRFCFECKWTFECNLKVVPGVYTWKSNIAWAHRSLAVTNSFASLSFLCI